MHTRFRPILMAAALLILAPAAARAQSTYDWSGPYAGAVIGGASATVEYTEPEFGDRDFDPGLGGFVAGVLAGFNRTMNGHVVGVEIDLGKASGSHEPDEDDENSYAAIDLGMNTHVRGRIGFPRNRSLFFLAIGLAALGAEVDDIDPGYGEGSGTHVGWTIGVGIEHALTDKLRVRAEYLHDSYSDKTHEISAPPGTDFAPSYGATLSPSANIFRGGVVLSF